jgi:2-polyprenyl-3-methyl-5-hydroxy-6-metoxy-1,4-benzoquinol methylase
MTKINSNILPQGIPPISDYTELLKTDLFLEMESFSNAFIKAHAKALREYPWEADPFHQWSRQWEYPFAYLYIQQYVQLAYVIHTNYKFRILDAGSGCTFFPYFLSYRIPNSIIHCCDNDYRLIPIFKQINKKCYDVEFNLCNLEEASYRDNSFDIIYCISVLEHTLNWKDIVNNFNQILKPNGLLIITFDISLDNKTHLTTDEAQDILDTLDGIFSPFNSLNSHRIIKSACSSYSFLTTQFMRTFNKNLLPHGKQTFNTRMLRLLTKFLKKESPSNLTVFCGAWKKRKK